MLSTLSKGRSPLERRSILRPDVACVVVANRFAARSSSKFKVLYRRVWTYPTVLSSLGRKHVNILPLEKFKASSACAFD
jgi:hypothetical protein